LSLERHDLSPVPPLREARISEMALSLWVWTPTQATLQELRQTVEIDHEAKPHVALEDSFVGFIDFVD